MMKEVLAIISVITALWLLSKSIRQRKKSKSILHEASPSQDSASDSGTDSSGFDVFLNFRGPDSRHTVADILYHILTNAGIRVFLDNEEIRKGEVIEGELLGAITNSRIYITIFSKDYASSRWCLRELAKMVECWQRPSGQAEKVILPIFYSVSVEDVKLRSQVYTSALRKHKKKLGKAFVKPWEDALLEVAKIKGWNLKDDGLYELANLIKEKIFSYINANEAVSSVSDRLVGIQEQMEYIMQLLQDGAPDVRFIVIHGMGGIGKTTLADAVFQNISSSFQGSCILKDVRRYSSDHDMVKLQEKLLLDTLSLKSIKVSNIGDGISQISKRLRNQKVLIVLDDVDKRDHLQNLAAKSDWYGPKSKIIITTRNIDFLPAKDDKEYCFHPMKEMDHVNGLKLFCRHAFDNDHPPAEYDDISSEIVDTTSGLPLALQVIGSSLRNQDKETWKFRLDKLQEAPYMDVQETLMISYQALEYEQQQIFLDIACFFNDEEMVDPIYFWEACTFYPKSAIKVLERRSLITVNEHDKILWMHDQLRDLGRAISHPKTQDQENKFFTKPSRFWSPEVALDIVQKKEVAESVVAIELGELDDGYCFVREEFEKAVNLKFLRLRGGNFQGDFKNVFRQLRWLSWDECPLKIEATNLSFTNLAVIKLSWSQITEDWTGWDAIMVAKQLKVLHLSQCLRLKKTPKFSSLLRLERLILIDCFGLEEIDSSINNLKHLDYLEISNRLGGGEARPRLLPAYLGDLKSLKMLTLFGAGLTELYPSIGELTSLVKLVICSELNLEELPDFIGNLRQLEILEIKSCLLNFLPESIGRLESLKELDLSGTQITQLPESFGNLKRLKVIKLGSTNLEELPKAIEELESLEELHARSCLYLHGELPEEIGRLSHLRIVDLERSTIARVPASITRLYHLQKLSLRLHEPQELLRLPASLTDLTVHFESAESPRFPDLSYMTNLVSLSLVHRPPPSWSHGAGQLHAENTRIDCLTRLLKLEKLELAFKGLIYPPTDLSSLCRLRTLEIAYTNPRFLTHLPSSLESLTLRDVESPIDWQVLSSLNNLSSLTLSFCRLEEVIVDSPVHLHSLEISWCDSLVRLSNLSYLKELRRLRIEWCPNLIDIQGVGELEFLQSLTISSCKFISRFPDLLGSMKLEKLVFWGCHFLESIPNINEKAPCRLSVDRCGHLRSFAGPYSNYHRNAAPGSCTEVEDIAHLSDSEDGGLG